jgi:tetratricopeptide (TPR) repeat protein
VPTTSDSGPSEVRALWSEIDVASSAGQEVPTERRVPEASVVIESGLTPAPDLYDAEQIEVGAQIGRYLVLDKLGSGGMCDVYAVYDRDLARKAAIKVVRPLNPKHVTPIEEHRLLREAQTMAQLAHPNVVTVFEVGLVGTRPFVAMEYVPGETLRRWMGRDRRWQETLHVFCEAGEGLIAAHEQGVIHRDFKPDNVLLSERGRVQVTDFGLADMACARVDSNLDADDVITFASENGLAFGTPAYMAPEQMRGEKTDPRADQFSFCVALYEALYRQAPFRSAKISQRHQQILAGNIVQPPKVSPIPRRLYKIIARGLSADPGMRYSSMAALIRDLRRAASAGRRRAAAISITVGALSALALGLLVSDAAMERTDECDGAQSQWGGIWDDAARAAGRDGFARFESGAQIWSQVAQQLDAHTTRWNSAFANNCRATRVEHSQAESIHELRTACLERGRREVEALVRLFAAPDQTAVRNAQLAVHNLTDPDQCSPVRVSFVIEPPEPDADAHAREAVQRELAWAKAHFDLGQFSQALDRAQSAADTGDKGGVDDLAVDALYLIGKAQWRSDRLEDAEDTLVLACARATSVGHSWLRAECLTDLVYVVGVERVDFNQARHWFQMASQSIQALGDPKILRGELLQTYATVLGTHGDVAEASTMAAQAFRDLTGALPASNARLGRAYNEYGNHLYYGGKLTMALEVYQQGLEIRMATLHPDHPDVAESLNNIAIVLNDMGMPDAALEMHGKALDIYRRAGDQKAEVAKSLSNIGLILLDAGKAQAARDHFAESLELELDVRGDQHPYVAITYAMLGAADEALGDARRAETAYRKAVNVIDRAPTSAQSSMETIDTLETVYQFYQRQKGGARRCCHQPAIAFRLARALVAAGRDPVRARALAGEAMRAYARAGRAGQAERRALARFVEEMDLGPERDDRPSRRAR